VSDGELEYEITLIGSYLMSNACDCHKINKLTCLFTGKQTSEMST